MKIVKKIAIIIAVIFFALVFYGMVSKISDDSAVQDLQSATVSTLSPTGELAEIFAFGTDYTDIQRENKLKEIKGSVVVWQLPVYEVKRDGENYSIQTQNPKTFGQGEAMVPAIITLMPQSDEDKAHIESLKTGDIISFKGTIYGVRMRHLLINPAYLHQAAARNVAADVATEPTATDANSDINASLAESSEELTKLEDPDSEWVPSFDCAKAATPVEKMICNDPFVGKLDGALASNYKTMMAADIGDGARDELKSTQMQWLASRDNCADNQCLVNAYKTRVDAVCEYPVLSGVHPGCVMADEIQVY
jgi:uncharacterized protein YecT (DUF1311 family)